MKVDTNEVYALTRTACSRIRNGAQGEFDDIVQEIMMYVLRNIDKYDPAKGKLSTFVFKNVHYGLINYRVMTGAKKRIWSYRSASLDKLVDAEGDTLSDRIAEPAGFDDELMYQQWYNTLTDKELIMVEEMLGNLTIGKAAKRMGMGEHKYKRLRNEYKNKIKSVFFADDLVY
jgi:DNA-directed RNA polymerase specialized sigma24 family protein